MSICMYICICTYTYECVCVSVSVSVSVSVCVSVCVCVCVCVYVCLFVCECLNEWERGERERERRVCKKINQQSVCLKKKQFFLHHNNGLRDGSECVSETHRSSSSTANNFVRWHLQIANWNFSTSKIVKLNWKKEKKIGWFLALNFSLLESSFYNPD